VEEGGRTHKRFSHVTSKRTQAVVEAESIDDRW